MEPHELAIAALNQVAQNTSYRQRAESSRTDNESPPSTASPNSKPLLPENKDESDHRLTTPPTSTSDISTPLKKDHDDTKCQTSQLSYTASTRESINHPLVTPLTAGQKRTADGQIKIESPITSALSPNHQNSRKSSTFDHSSNMNGPRIVELTSELRTRLSYAMVKVNNGWQSNSIDEVESLASQKKSPISLSSVVHGRQHFNQSPRATIASIQGQIGSSPHVTPGDFDACCRLDQPCRTYESFWRDHSVTENPNNRQSPNRQVTPCSAPRTLAPPVEIRHVYSHESSTPRRYNKTRMKPHCGSQSPSTVSGPQTPQRVGLQEATPLNASSQTTVQEQDAIETLIFMSSPGNLSNMGNILPPPKPQIFPQQSPLRSEIYFSSKSTPGGRIGSKIGSSASDKITGQNRGQVRSSAASQTQERSAVIDCLLEEMGDSSSEDDEAVLRYSNSQGVTMRQI